MHPRDALFADGGHARRLPAVDHYCGSEKSMRKSLALQAKRGPVFDVTLDCEDGAAVGAEDAHIRLICSLLSSPENAHGRVGVRVHPIGHPAFDAELAELAACAVRPAYLMLPKIESIAQLRRGVAAVHAAWATRRPPPLHVLIETHGALREVESIAAQAEVESLSFGLMDFVSAHEGAIPRSAMTLEGQFRHPLVCRAKLAISAAAHGHGKTPSHCVVTELNGRHRLQAAARQAWRDYGYPRMWSIHPDQIDPILTAMAPDANEIDEASNILLAAQDADWGPIRHKEHLHDRASYRYFWSVLERAAAGGHSLPPSVQARFFSAGNR